MVEVLRQTPLNDLHEKSRATMVDFHHWEMPQNYPAGIRAEHLAVREDVGIFDVSHMGELEFSGQDAEPFLEYVFTNNVRDMVEGQARYGMLCNEDGVIIDDDIIYKGKDRWWMVVNAASINVVFDRLERERQLKEFQVEIKNISDEITLLALQGPKALEKVSQLSPTLGLGDLRYYHFRENVSVDGVKIAIASKTGYTGEDGFELMSDVEGGRKLWEMFIDNGIQPCGLGARNTLRVEAGLPLGGNEISRRLNGRGVSPLEAGLGRFVDYRKDFIGREALVNINKAIKMGKWDRQLVGFETVDRGIVRDDMNILSNGEKIGIVTSGAPLFVQGAMGKTIGMGYVKLEFAKEGTQFQVDVRGNSVNVLVVPLPFYKREVAA